MNNSARKQSPTGLFGPKYYSRQERALYTVRTFGEFLFGSVLDIGSGGAGLCAHLEDCISIDINPLAYPDVFVDLERGGLPFAGASFDAVVCTDVLEHLDNIHGIFHEMARVTRRFILISLPNNWLSARKAVFLGSPGGSMKYYGLPLDYPGDRHRWFFSYTEAERFLRGMSERLNLEVRELRPYFGRRNQVKVRLLSPFLSYHRLCNLYASSIWTVLARSVGK